MSREFIEEYLNSFKRFIENNWKIYKHRDKYFANLEYINFEYDFKEAEVATEFEEDGTIVKSVNKIRLDTEFKFKLTFDDKEYKMPYHVFQCEYQEQDQVEGFYNQIFMTLLRSSIYGKEHLNLRKIINGEVDLNGIVFHIEGDPNREKVILNDIVDKYLAKQAMEEKNNEEKKNENK